MTTESYGWMLWTSVIDVDDTPYETIREWGWLPIADARVAVLQFRNEILSRVRMTCHVVDSVPMANIRALWSADASGTLRAFAKACARRCLNARHNWEVLPAVWDFLRGDDDRPTEDVLAAIRADHLRLSREASHQAVLAALDGNYADAARHSAHAVVCRRQWDHRLNGTSATERERDAWLEAEHQWQREWLEAAFKELEPKGATP